MTPDGPADAGLAVSRAVFRDAWRLMLWLLAGLLVVGGVVGAAVSGWRGVWGALLGVAVAALFSGTTVVSVGRTVGADPIRMVSVVLGSWIVKMLVVFVLLLALSHTDFFDRLVMGGVMLAGVVGSALLDYRAVTRGRITYVEPAQDEGRNSDRSEGPRP